MVILVWFPIRYYDNLVGHCGFDFSWDPINLLPFAAGARYHDYHHSVNIGNYGSFLTFWDTIYGTNTVFNKYTKELDAENNAKTNGKAKVN